MSILFLKKQMLPLGIILCGSIIAVSVVYFGFSSSHVFPVHASDGSGSGGGSVDTGGPASCGNSTDDPGACGGYCDNSRSIDSDGSSVILPPVCPDGSLQPSHVECTGNDVSERCSTFYDACPAVTTCQDVTRTAVQPCVVGETGAGRTYTTKSNTCTPGQWSAWSLVQNACTVDATCDPLATTTVVACALGETGTGRAYEAQSNTCSTAWTPWNLITDSCTTGTCTSTSTKTVVACAAGETGTGRVYESTSDSCVSGIWSPWSPWSLLSSDCVGGGGSVTPTSTPVAPTANLSVHVIGSPTPFSPGPLTIAEGDEIELHWTATHATRCIGDVFSTNTGIPGTPSPTAGTQTNVIEPTAGNTKTYTVLCDNGGEPATASVVVTKSISSGTPTLTAQPNRVHKGGLVTISGNRGGQSDCILSGKNVGGVGIDSLAITTEDFSQSSIAIQGETTFTLSCATPGATVSSVVYVFPNIEEI